MLLSLFRFVLLRPSTGEDSPPSELDGASPNCASSPSSGIMSLAFCCCSVIEGRLVEAVLPLVLGEDFPGMELDESNRGRVGTLIRPGAGRPDEEPGIDGSIWICDLML